MDPLDVEQEVEVDDLMVLRDVHRVDLLLLTAEVVFDLEVVAEVVAGCHWVDCLLAPPPGGTPPPVGLLPGPPPPLGALPVGIFGSPPPAIYELREAPRLWQKERDQQLREFEFLCQDKLAHLVQSHIHSSLWFIVEGAHAEHNCTPPFDHHMSGSMGLQKQRDP